VALAPLLLGGLASPEGQQHQHQQHQTERSTRSRPSQGCRLCFLCFWCWDLGLVAASSSSMQCIAGQTLRWIPPGCPAAIAGTLDLVGAVCSSSMHAVRLGATLGVVYGVWTTDLFLVCVVFVFDQMPAGRVV
jgi:hypothetical protein